MLVSIPLFDQIELFIVASHCAYAGIPSTWRLAGTVSSHVFSASTDSATGSRSGLLPHPRVATTAIALKKVLEGACIIVVSGLVRFAIGESLGARMPSACGSPLDVLFDTSSQL